MVDRVMIEVTETLLSGMWQDEGGHMSGGKKRDQRLLFIALTKRGKEGLSLGVDL